uniref:Ig-like domain-containing protein n=1 Tax=Strongyloides papillosus TaxID=174720 RepID=A0A0N5BXX7_STREA
MEKLLKVLWILAVYMIYLSPCGSNEEPGKHFQHYQDYKAYAVNFPKKYIVKTNTEIVAVKCPLEDRVKHSDNSTIIFKRHSENLKESLILKSKVGNDHLWRFYDIGKTGTKVVNCLNIYKNDETHLLAEWKHEISRTSTEQINITCINNFNTMNHIPGKNINELSGSEITVAFSGKSNYRELNSKNPQVYKGDTLVVFDGDMFDSKEKEFLEPICIVRPYHPPPSINIIGIENIKNNTKNKEWPLVEVENFPKELEIKLEYNGETKQHAFFQYEKINVYYFDFTKENEFYNYKNMTLEPDQDGKKIFQLEHPAIVKFEYNCDYCGESSTNIEKKIIFGDNDYFKREIKSLVRYKCDHLGFNANCSMVIKKNFYLKNAAINGLAVAIKDFDEVNDNETPVEFMLLDNTVIYDYKNPIGPLKCTYSTPFGEIQLVQQYDCITDPNPTLTGYYYNKLPFKANCSKKEKDVDSLKTVLFNDEKISITDDGNTIPESTGNFTSDEKFFFYNNTNPKGELKCIYKLSNGNLTISKKFEYFENITLPPVKYSFENPYFKANCSLKRNEFTDLKTVLFNGKIIEVKDLQKGKTKNRFKLEGTSVNFIDCNPNGTLYCVYKLTFGEFTTSQEFEYINNETLPNIVYPDGQLYFFPNCSVDKNNYTRLNSISLGDKIVYIEGERNFREHVTKKDNHIIYRGENPNGKFVCTYKISHGQINLTQNYYTLKNETLPPVIYSNDQLTFNPNCSKKEKHSIDLKTIIFNDKSMDVGDISKVESNSVENFKLTKDFVMYEVENPVGELVCLYNISIGTFKKSQKYVSIQSETLPIVKYYYNELGYHPNCTLNPNNFTTLKAVTFGAERVKVRNLRQEKDFTRKIFKMEKGFVKVMSGDSGTLTCVYALPTGEISISQTFEALTKNNGHNLSFKFGILLIIIFNSIIIKNLFIISM